MGRTSARIGRAHDGRRPWARWIALGGLGLAWAVLGITVIVRPSHAATALWTLMTWCLVGAGVAAAAWSWATSPPSGEQVEVRAEIARPVIVAIIALETIAIAFTLVSLD